MPRGEIGLPATRGEMVPGIVTGFIIICWFIIGLFIIGLFIIIIVFIVIGGGNENEALSADPIQLEKLLEKVRIYRDKPTQHQRLPF